MKSSTIHHRNRHGFTLVEVLIAATISSLVAALSIGLIVSLMSFQSAAKANADRQRTVARLIEIFRADAHRAETTEIEELSINHALLTGKSIVFRDGDQRAVRYTLAVGEISRCITSDEKRIASDSFLFDKDTTLDVALENTGTSQFAVLTILRKTAANTTSGRQFPPIVAAIGNFPSEVEVYPSPKAEADEPTAETKAGEKEGDQQ